MSVLHAKLALMANGAAHRVVGGFAGLGAAMYVARNEPDAVKVALQLFGGLVGGVHGGALPDIVEPADTPRHRGPFHSLAFAAGGIGAIKNYGAQCVEAIQGEALRLEAQLDHVQGTWQRIGAVAVLLFAYFAIGYTAGVAAGYASHLALDGATPNSLPLLGA